MLYSTRIYGLKVQLNQEIPGVVSRDICGAIDLEVHFGFFPSWFETAHQKNLWYLGPNNDKGIPRLLVWKITQENCYHFCYADNTQFLVDGQGSVVWAKWPAALTVEDTATYLLGPVMGFVLLLHGCISLHASALAIGNSAIAIVGPAGAGKSTAAAAFADLGYKVLTEDVLTLRECDDFFLVEPGYPCIRLWPDSVEALWGTSVELPKLTPTWDKRFLDLGQIVSRFEDRALPLKAIYIIDSRSEISDAPHVSAMTQRQALLALVANTYASYLMNKQMRATEFKVLSRLLKTVKVQSLTPHSDPSRIADLCRTILEDFETSNFDNASQTQTSGIHV